MTKWISNDGWDLDRIEPLGDASLAIDDLDQLNYQLKNCVRQGTIVSMRDELISAAQRILDAVEEIDDYDTVEEEEAQE
jgi:hypothetical protein